MTIRSGRVVRRPHVHYCRRCLKQSECGGRDCPVHTNVDAAGNVEVFPEVGHALDGCRHCPATQPSSVGEDSK